MLFQYCVGGNAVWCYTLLLLVLYCAVSAHSLRWWYCTHTCICMCVCTCLHMYRCIYSTYICTCTYVYTYACMHACTYVYMYVRMYCMRIHNSYVQSTWWSKACMTLWRQVFELRKCLQLMTLHGVINTNPSHKFTSPVIQITVISNIMQVYRHVHIVPQAIGYRLQIVPCATSYRLQAVDRAMCYKLQATGCRSCHVLQATGYRSCHVLQATGYRL